MQKIQIDFQKMKQEKKFKNALDRNIENNLKYWERVKKELEAKETQAKNIKFREEMLRKIKANNYRMEKEKLMGILHNTVIPRATHNLIQKRIDEIKSFNIV